MLVRDHAQERVILLRGLNRSARSLRRLKAALVAAGFGADTWSYPSRRDSIQDLVGRFRQFLQASGEQRTVHIVTHLLGGLLARGALVAPVPVRVGRIVMIAPPNQGVVLGDLVLKIPGLVLAYGKPLHDLSGSNGYLRTLPTPDAEIGVIAGTRPFRLFAPTSYVSTLRRRRVVHDGAVALDQARLPGMRDFIILARSHSFICDDGHVGYAVVNFLREGSFSGMGKPKRV